jgi:hypothetical protein
MIARSAHDWMIAVSNYFMCCERGSVLACIAMQSREWCRSCRAAAVVAAHIPFCLAEFVYNFIVNTVLIHISYPPIALLFSGKWTFQLVKVQGNSLSNVCMLEVADSILWVVKPVPGRLCHIEDSTSSMLKCHWGIGTPLEAFGLTQQQLAFLFASLIYDLQRLCHIAILYPTSEV